MLPGFAPGKRYNWQVVAKNACSQTASAIQSFHIGDLPNLIVQSIAVAPSVFSGQTVDVDVVIKNIGKGVTKNALWMETVYLSEDTVLEYDGLNHFSDQRLTSKNEIMALDSGKSYHTHIPVKFQKISATSIIFSLK